MQLIERLKALSLQLPEVSTPGGNYVSVNIRANIAYVAIQFPILNQQFLYQGCLGQDLTTEDGYKALQLAALNVVAQVERNVGLDRIAGLNHLDIYYCATDSWDDGPIVANGASDLFVHLLGDKGIHTRSLFGVQHLPRRFCVGLTATFTTLPGRE